LPGETVLNALLRAGINMPFSSKAGVCHTCLIRCTEGMISERAQRGLAPDFMDGVYFGDRPRHARHCF
jgi:ferredoxin